MLMYLMVNNVTTGRKECFVVNGGKIWKLDQNDSFRYDPKFGVFFMQKAEIESSWEREPFFDIEQFIQKSLGLLPTEIDLQIAYTQAFPDEQFVWPANTQFEWDKLICIQRTNTGAYNCTCTGMLTGLYENSRVLHWDYGDHKFIHYANTDEHAVARTLDGTILPF